MSIHLSAKHNVITLPYNERVKQFIPTAKVLESGSRGRLLVIPNGRDEVRILRNLGISMSAPILTNYKWPGDEPFRAQRVTAAMLTMNRRAYVLNDMGTGKTRSTLYAYDYLRKTGEVNKALVIAPLSTLSPVWDAEIFRTFPHYTTSVLHGTRDKRKAAFDKDADVYIINHDATHILAEWMAGKRPDIDLIIVDELASFRTAGTRRWKGLQELLVKRKWVWGLTGSPTPNAPTDAWGQCRLLTPENVPKFFGAFRQQTMRKITQFKWLPRENANDTVYDAMQPSVRFMRDDCIDLPPAVYSNRELELTPKQKKTYSDMVSKQRVLVDEDKITAANEAVALNKLLQIACGFIYTKDRAILIDFQKRVTALKELLEENIHKTIVFVPYVEAVKQLAAELAKDYSIAKIDGGVSKAERDQIFSAFQREANPRVLVAHPKTMSHGLTLTEASTVVWFSPPQSLEIYEQANARITRPGQKNQQLIAHLMAKGTVESKVYSRLRNRAKMQGVLLDMFRCEDYN